MNVPTLCPATQCNKRLDFRPVTPWPTGLPGVAFDGWVVSGFDRDLFLNYAWDRQDPLAFTGLFSSVHPYLSFAELARLIPMIIDCREIDIENLISYYGYKDKIQFSLVGEKLTQLPPEFQDWAARRRLSPKEFAPLLSTEITADLRLAFAEIVRRDLTRQEGTRAIELVTELLLMGHREPVAQSLKADRWLDTLQHLRHPQATKQDESAQTWVLDQSWPRHSQIRWVRQGDQSGLEVKMIIRNPQDLEKSKDSLDRIEKIFEQAPDHLWRKH